MFRVKRKRRVHVTRCWLEFEDGRRVGVPMTNHVEEITEGDSITITITGRNLFIAMDEAAVEVDFPAEDYPTITEETNEEPTT